MDISKYKQGQFILVSKSLAALPEQLQPNEQPVIIISGAIGNDSGVLTLTNLRALWLSKRFLSSDIIDVPISKMTSANLDKGFTSKIKITYSGGNLEIKAHDSAAATAFVTHLRNALNAPATPAVPPPPTEDRIGKLERLVSLKNAGILTDAEFDAEKAKILSS